MHPQIGPQVLKELVGEYTVQNPKEQFTGVWVKKVMAGNNRWVTDQKPQERNIHHNGNGINKATNHVV